MYLIRRSNKIIKFSFLPKKYKIIGWRVSLFIKQKMSEESKKFEEISNQVLDKSITVEDALEKIKNIDFNKFDFKEIQNVNNCSWLPNDVSVAITKQWMDIYNSALNQMRGYLVLNPVISKDLLLKISSATQTPLNMPELCVHNIIHRLATGGETHTYINPITNNLITASIEPKDDRINTVYKIYEEDPYACFISSPHPQNSLIISLPAYLKVQVEKYQISTPMQKTTKKGGIQSWVIEVSNDLESKNWVQIAEVKNSQALISENVTQEFDIDNKNAGFYRHIKLITTGINQLGNLSMIIRNFDISGRVLLSKE